MYLKMTTADDHSASRHKRHEVSKLNRRKYAHFAIFYYI